MPYASWSRRAPTTSRSWPAAGARPGRTLTAVLHDPELRGAADAAHYYGRLTTAHRRAAWPIANAVEADADCIEHAEFNEPADLIRHIAEGPNHRPQWNQEIAKRLADLGTFASLTLPGSGYVAYRTVREKEERGEALDEVQQRQIEVAPRWRAEPTTSAAS